MTVRPYTVRLSHDPRRTAVHVVLTSRQQNGAHRVAVCGATGRTFRTTDPVTCPRCKAATR